MSQFLGMALFLTVVMGMALHGAIDLPWFFDWVGSLPGDMVVRKGSMSVYVPVTSALLVSAAVSLFFSALKPKKS